MDLFHIQTRRLWAGICHDNIKMMYQAMEAGAALNSWQLKGCENDALRPDIQVNFFQRPILAAALAERYDMVDLLMREPTVKLNAVYAVRPSLECSLEILGCACKAVGGWDETIQKKISKLKRPRSFFFSLADIVRLNQAGEQALIPFASQIVLTPDMTDYLEQVLKKRKISSRDEIPNIAAVLSQMADKGVFLR